MSWSIKLLINKNLQINVYSCQQYVSLSYKLTLLVWTHTDSQILLINYYHNWKLIILYLFNSTCSIYPSMSVTLHFSYGTNIAAILQQYCRNVATMWQCGLLSDLWESVYTIITKIITRARVYEIYNTC